MVAMTRLAVLGKMEVLGVGFQHRLMYGNMSGLVPIGLENLDGIDGLVLRYSI